MAANDPISSRSFSIAVIGACVAAAEALYTLVWLIAVRFRDVGLLPSFPMRAALAGIAMRAW